MLSHILILVLLAAIFYSLGSACYYLVRNGSQSKAFVKALFWRLGLSFVLLIGLFIAYILGWISPHGMGG